MMRTWTDPKTKIPRTLKKSCYLLFKKILLIKIDNRTKENKMKMMMVMVAM